jgi:hypothetical protein
VLPRGPGERDEQLLELRVARVELVQLGQYFLGFLLLAGGLVDQRIAVGPGGMPWGGSQAALIPGFSPQRSSGPGTGDGLLLGAVIGGEAELRVAVGPEEVDQALEVRGRVVQDQAGVGWLQGAGDEHAGGGDVDEREPG